MSSHHQSDFDVRDRQALPDCPSNNSGQISQTPCDLDVVKRDRFELLSAYLDGEVSSQERRLVSAWLTDDPEAQCLYRRLLCLRQGFSTICKTPTPAESPEILTSKVYQRLNHGLQRTCMASFAAIALAVFGVFSGTLSNRLWGNEVLQGTNPLMGQNALEVGSGPNAATPSVTIASESRMETLVEQVNSQPNSIDMGSEL